MNQKQNNNQTTFKQLIEIIEKEISNDEYKEIFTIYKDDDEFNYLVNLKNELISEENFETEYDVYIENQNDEEICFYYYKDSNYYVGGLLEDHHNAELIKEKLIERINDVIEEHISYTIDLRVTEYLIKKEKEKIKCFDRMFPLMMKCKQKRIIDDIMTII